MELLDIKLPSMTRKQFANLECEQIWKEKINIGAKLYPKLEFETVKHDIRKCMIMHNVHPWQIDELTINLAKKGLIIIPISRENISNGFGHVSYYDGGNSFVYRCVVTKSISDANDFVEAHHNNDDIRIGELLGYPKCCSEFFDTAWKQGYYDPIWQQAENTNSSNILKNKRDFKLPSGEIKKKLIRFKEDENNYKILSTFRYIGIRVIPHFACKFDCQESIKVANDWIKLAEDLKLEGLNETLEILRLPFEWDCYKGLAIINTPVMKIVTTSMPCYPNHIIQQENNFYPKEAPTGIQFPWQFKFGC